MGVAEWEYLDPKEWDEATTAAAAGVGKAGDGYDDAVMVGGARRDVGKGLLDDGMGVMSRMEVGEEGRGGDEGDEGKVKGTSGWTKLKAR